LERSTWKVRGLPFSGVAASVPFNAYAMLRPPASAAATAMRAADDGARVSVAMSAESGPIDSAGAPDNVPADSPLDRDLVDPQNWYFLTGDADV